jgi:6-phosphogluconolactonase
LTLPEILNASRIILHIEGNDKWAVLQDAIAGFDETVMPIRAVLHDAAAKLEVFWAPKL